MTTRNTIGRTLPEDAVRDSLRRVGGALPDVAQQVRGSAAYAEWAAGRERPAPGPSRTLVWSVGAAVLTAATCLTGVAIASLGPGSSDAPPSSAPTARETPAPRATPEQVQQAAVALSALHGLEGFGEVRILDGGAGILLVWKGAVPDDVREVEARHPAVDVDVQEAAYSADELTAEARRLLRGHPGIGVVSLEPTAAYDGLRILTREDLTAQQRRVLEADASVPLTFALAGSADGTEASVR